MGIWWSSRNLDAEGAAQLLCRLNSAILEFGPPFDRLYTLRDRPSDVLLKLTDDPSSCLEIIVRSRNFTDVGHAEIPELGFSAAFAEEVHSLRKAAVWFSVGATAPGYPNFVTVDLPVATVHNDETRRRLLAILEAVCEVADPDWGRIGSNRILDLLPRQAQGEISLGWYTYLSDRETSRRPPLPVFPRPTRILGAPGGVVIELTSQWLEADDEAHAWLVVESNRRMKDAGW